MHAPVTSPTYPQPTMPTPRVEPVSFVSEPLLTKRTFHHPREGEGQSTSAKWPTGTAPPALIATTADLALAVARNLRRRMVVEVGYRESRTIRCKWWVCSLTHLPPSVRW